MKSHISSSFTQINTIYYCTTNWRKHLYLTPQLPESYKTLESSITLNYLEFEQLFSNLSTHYLHTILYHVFGDDNTVVNF